jgi:hypothetical protein
MDLPRYSTIACTIHYTNLRWIYQGYALVVGGGLGSKHAGAFKAFTSSVPEGQFIVLDMSAHGQGQWRDKGWKGDWGLPVSGALLIEHTVY